MQKIWHLKRIYSINIDNGTLAQFSLGPVLKNEDSILNIQVVSLYKYFLKTSILLKFQKLLKCY